MPYNPYEDADEQTIMAQRAASWQERQAAEMRAMMQQQRLMSLLARQQQREKAQRRSDLWGDIRLQSWLNPDINRRTTPPEGPRKINEANREIYRRRLLEQGARPVEVEDIINQFLGRDEGRLSKDMQAAFNEAKYEPMKLSTDDQNELIASLVAKRSTQPGKLGGMEMSRAEATALIKRFDKSGGDSRVFKPEELQVPKVAEYVEAVKRFRQQPPKPRPQEAYVYEPANEKRAAEEEKWWNYVSDLRKLDPEQYSTNEMMRPNFKPRTMRREVYAGGGMGNPEPTLVERAPRGTPQAQKEDQTAIQRWYSGADQKAKPWQQQYSEYTDPNWALNTQGPGPDIALVHKVEEQRREDLKKRAMAGDRKALWEIITSEGDVLPRIRETARQTIPEVKEYLNYLKGPAQFMRNPAMGMARAAGNIDVGKLTTPPPPWQQPKPQTGPTIQGEPPPLIGFLESLVKSAPMMRGKMPLPQQSPMGSAYTGQPQGYSPQDWWDRIVSAFQ